MMMIMRQKKTEKKRKYSSDAATTAADSKEEEEEEEMRAIINKKKKKYQRPICPDTCPVNAGKVRYLCMIHSGSALCPLTCPSNAGKRKVFCFLHGGSALCPLTCIKNAGKQRVYCVIHGGSALCPNTCPSNGGKKKVFCFLHGGAALCPLTCINNAGKQKVYCLAHGGSSLCPSTCETNAGKAKVFCDFHGGSALCPVVDCSSSNIGRRKAYCITHGGQLLCIGCKTIQVKRKGNSCGTCVPVASKQARVREARMAATLEKWASDGLSSIPKYNLWNKSNRTADPAQCGKYRLDFVYEWAEGVLVLEYDEKMHSDRVKRCELVRMAEVSLGYGGRPVFWIRYNPDAFKVDGSTLVTSRKRREAVLLKMLQEMIGDADYDHVMTICYLCYDDKAEKNTKGEDNLVQTFKFTTMQEYEVWVNAVAPAVGY